MAYDGKADLGGRAGFGPVVPEPEGELFHAAWEPRALALTLAMGATGSWNIDMSRAARETLDDYARLSYYQIWIGGLCKLMQERGLVSAEEIRQGLPLQPALPVARVLRASDVPRVLAQGSPTERPAASAPLYQAGQRVRMRDVVPMHHTRLPGYVRGRVGVVERVLGAHVFADSHAHGKGEDPHWLYTVAFSAATLWGGDSLQEEFLVSIDAWEPYLEAQVPPEPTEAGA